MLMATAFLPVVFNNLPPIIRSHHLWVTLWGISLVIFYPKIFFNKALLYLLVFGLFLFIASETIWSSIDEWNYRMLFTEYYQLLVGVSVITYFHQTKDYIHLAKITKWSIIFFSITAIMTIVSSVIDPLYARNLTRISIITNEAEREAVLSFRRFGGGTYSTAAAFMSIFPIFIYYFKDIKTSILSKKQIIFFLVLVFLALLGMQIFTNIIIAVFFSILALLGMKKIKQSIVVMSIFFSIAIFTPKETYINSLLSISNYFDKDSELNYKFRDLAIFISIGADIEDKSTGVGGRAERYPMLLETFVKSPVLGCYTFSDKSGNGYQVEGVHLHWMNKLTVTGIIGMVFFLIIPYITIKKNLGQFNSTYKFYYILAALTILIYGFMKTISGRETWYAFFIILPGLYYLPRLKNNTFNAFRELK